MLGIDVSKDRLVCALFDPRTERFCWEKSFPNTPTGREQLLCLTPTTAPWVLEPTGRWSLAVARDAQAAGRTVLLACSKKAKAYLASRQTRAKTDRLDSRGLAEYANSRPASQPLRPYPVRRETLEHLHQLLTARRGLTEASTALKLRLAELPYAAAALQAAIAELEQQRKVLDRQIARLTADRQAFPELERLLAVPGIGPLTAATLLSRLQAGTFERADAFVAYVGLDVGIIASGKRKGERGLTKEGDAELRRLLFLCARSTVRSEQSPFRAQYERERKRGRSATAATNIIARKLARICWSVVRHGTPYDPNRIYQQPLPPNRTAPQPLAEP